MPTGRSASAVVAIVGLGLKDQIMRLQGTWPFSMTAVAAVAVLELEVGAEEA